MLKPLKNKRVPPEALIIGINLKLLRERTGLSQNQVGRLLGVSFQQVQKYERGINRLPIEKLFVLKHIYNVEYTEFFFGLDHFLERVLITGKDPSAGRGKSPRRRGGASGNQVQTYEPESPLPRGPRTPRGHRGDRR